MPKIVVDPDSRSLAEHPAVVKGARRRARFPAGCVTAVADEAAARAGANPARNLHAAVVYGPSTSSEGLQVYYLVRWLD
ncbi:MAG: hypothetical protein MUE39_01710 [Gammaproteobacteria bacterium]|jgi:hypothetical protein|nr:hypothetical protein [Gammaproteobacteria bacterium]